MIEPDDQVKEISFLETGMESSLGGNPSGRSGHRSHGSDQERQNRRSRCSSSTSLSSRSRSSQSSASRRHRSPKQNKRTPRRREKRSSSSRSRSRSGRQGPREEQRERRRCRERKERRACSKTSSRSSSETRLSESRNSRRHQPRNDDSGKLEYNVYKFQEPSRTIMIRGLPIHLTEDDIREDVQEFGMAPRNVRVIRNRDTGVPRGFAFVDFYTVSDAVRWIEMKKGVLILRDRYRSNLEYSTKKTCGIVADWMCSLCQGINFKRRSNCYKCNEPRPAEDVLLNQLATNTLVLENLDVLTTEETILQSIQSRRAISTISIMAVKILRDSTTKISEGVCHLKTHCISDAEKIYECFQADPLKIDGRDVFVKCSPDEEAPEIVNKNLATDALGASRWSNRLSTQGFNSEIQYSASGEINVEALSQASARMYAGTMDEYTTYVQYYRKFYTEQKTNGTLGNIDGLGATSAPGYVSQLSAMNVFNPGSAGSSEFKNISNDSSTFLGVSGTEFANDKVKSASKSIAKPPSRTRVSMEQDPTRITKEIDKWMNQPRKKQQKSKQISAPFSSKGFPLSTSTQLNQSKTGSSKYKEQDYGSTVKPSLETNQNETTNASPTSSLIDEVSLSCLLCKRRFRSKEVLLKHSQISEMHLQNLKDLALMAAT